MLHAGRTLLAVGQRLDPVRRDAGRHQAAALYYGLALIILLASIPWPGMPAGRPLFWGF